MDELRLCAAQAARNEGGSKHERVIEAYAKSRDRSAAAREIARVCNFARARKPAIPTPVVEVYARWFPMLSSGRGKKLAGRLVARLETLGAIGSGTGRAKGGPDYRRSPDTSPSSLSSRFYRFARASARRGKCKGRMIARVFLTQKARKPTPKYGGACGAPCNRRRPRPGLSLSSWWDNHFQNCDSRLQIRRERETGPSAGRR